MMPNSTLFIQMGSFLFAYWLIARFFFRPVIAEIDRLDEALFEQQNAIEQERQRIARMRIQLSGQWHDYQQALKNTVPKPFEIEPHTQVDIHPLSPLSGEEREKTCAHLTRLLTERVLHD